MMTDSPLATPTIALQCDHPPLALQRRRRTLPRVVVRAPLVRRGARRGAAWYAARPTATFIPRGVVSSAGRSGGNLRVGGSMTYL